MGSTNLFIGRIAKILLSFLTLILATSFCFGQDENKKATISGYVHDSSNGEALIGVSVYIEELASGMITNEYGFYSNTLKKGNYTLRFSYVGFVSRLEKTPLTDDLRLDIELEPESTQLQEIVVEEESFSNAENLVMSSHKMNINTILKIPSFAGETDVLRSILTLPGVSTVGEGASGFNVRGGGVGQNVTLLDEAPVYNPSHLFGFFSIFNPNAVKDITLYKGAIPARYGGRLASVLDIRMKEGNNKKFAVNGGVGIIFSNLAVEGPIVKNKASFIAAARRSYADVFTRLLSPNLKDQELYFYDVTLKANYILGKKDKFYLSGYLGRDAFKFTKKDGFNWGNITGTARWNHLYNDKLFSNTTFVYSRYNYQLLFDTTSIASGMDWRSSMSNLSFKTRFTYFINDKNELDFGASANYYNFNPGNASVKVREGNDRNVTLDKKYNAGLSIYAGNKQKIARFLSLEYGVRFSLFWSLGPSTEYRYTETIPGLRKTPSSPHKYEEGKIAATYNNVEPRISFNMQLGKYSSIKGSYNRMAQYLHLISNSAASSPLDVWAPSSRNIKPEIGDQFTLGYFRTLDKQKGFEVSAEFYYRQTQNQVSYIDGARVLLNRFLEGDLLSGRGRAYGMELLCQRKKGRLNGWISYTLGKTELKVEQINAGEWYPTRYDQPHNLSITLMYQISKRVSVSSNFTYITGTPVTLPTSRYVINGTKIYHTDQGSRNNARIPDYHRLDIATHIEGKKINKKGKKKRFVSSWDIGIYNVYARKNPFSVRFITDNNNRGKAVQLSIIGFITPSVSWNFHFL